MAWYFNNIGSGDDHSNVYEQTPNLRVSRQFYWSSRGMVEVRSERGSRVLSLDVFLGTGAEYNLPRLADEVELYNTEIGEHGDLVVDVDNSTFVYENCTLDSIERIDQTPVPDEGDVLWPIGTAVPAYMQRLRLNFTQLVTSNIRL